jgi:hypothetical protein
MNPLSAGTNTSITNGNLNFAITSTSLCCAQGSMGTTSGQFYCEITAIGTEVMVGLSNSSVQTLSYIGSTAQTWGYWGNNGSKYNNGSATAYGSSYTTGDVIAIAFDASAGNVTFYKNNVSQGVAFTGLTNGPYFFAVGNGTNANCSVNFGQQGFKYTPPTGFLALNTFNM